MAYDRIPGVDENYRFPPEVEGGVEQAMMGKAVAHLNVTVPNKLVKTNDQGYVTANTPYSGPQVTPKAYVDGRVPPGLAIRDDYSVGKRIFIGDVMVYGDTGWRELTLTSGVSGSIRLRRINNEARVVITDLHPDVDSPNSMVVAALDYGFRSPSRSIFTLTKVNSLSDIARLWIQSGSMTILGGLTTTTAWLSSSGLIGSYSWPVSDDWPSFLPGTPV